MRYALIAILALLALLIIAPPLLGTGWQYALINALIAALFAAAFNLLVGQGACCPSAMPPTSASAPSP